MSNRKGEEEKGRMKKQEREQAQKKFDLNSKIRLFFLFFSFSLLFLAACQPNQSILKSSSQDNSSAAATNANTPVSNEPETFETGLRGVQSGNYTFVTVFRRKDGAAFDKDDRRFIKAVIPSETNQIVLTDGDRAVITGSNFIFPSDILNILRDRFTVEDFSKPTNANDNTNSAAGNFN